MAFERQEQFYALIEECLAQGRRRSEIAALLAREYDLDAVAIAGLIASHAARRIRRSASAALTSAYIAFVGLASKHEQVDVPFLTFI